MKLALALAAVLAMLVLASSALAMLGQFNSTGQITPNGANVSGPTRLDPDELGTVVTASVKQGNCTATGVSGYTTGATWHAHVTGCSFHSGPAMGYGVGYTTEADGSHESYPWKTAITLG